MTYCITCHVCWGWSEPSSSGRCTCESWPQGWVGLSAGACSQSRAAAGGPEKLHASTAQHGAVPHAAEGTIAIYIKLKCKVWNKMSLSKCWIYWVNYSINLLYSFYGPLQEQQQYCASLQENKALLDEQLADARARCTALRELEKENLLFRHKLVDLESVCSWFYQRHPFQKVGLHIFVMLYNCMCVGARCRETEGGRAVGDEYESAGGSEASGSFSGCRPECDSSAFPPIRAGVWRWSSGDEHSWDRYE